MDGGTLLSGDLSMVNLFANVFFGMFVCVQIHTNC
jgi:hypothetical protein